MEKGEAYAASPFAFQFGWLQVCLAFMLFASPSACVRSSRTDPLKQGRPAGQSVTDYASLIGRLRRTGVSVEAAGRTEQPFFSVAGRAIEVDGEDVQVFQYSRTAAADAQAAMVSADGGTVGASKVNWMGPPHFYKIQKLIILYVGDDTKTLKVLDAALGSQFAGK